MGTGIVLNKKEKERTSEAIRIWDRKIVEEESRRKEKESFSTCPHGTCSLSDWCPGKDEKGPSKAKGSSNRLIPCHPYTHAKQ